MRRSSERRPGARTRSRRGAVAVAVALLMAGAACREPPREFVTRRALLEREAEHLRRYVAVPEDRSLVGFEDLSVTVRGGVVQDLLSSLLPHRVVVEDRLRLDLRRATVRFRNGLALVQLEGRASPVRDSSTFGEFALFGTLEVLGIDAGAQALRTRIRVHGLQARDVGVGFLRPPVERLLNQLAPESATALEGYLSRVRIPVRLEERVPLPRVELDEVTIPADSLSLGLAIRDVKVLRDRLWVSVGVAVGGSSPTPRPAAADAVGAP